MVAGIWKGQNVRRSGYFIRALTESSPTARYWLEHRAGGRGHAARFADDPRQYVFTRYLGKRAAEVLGADRVGRWPSAAYEFLPKTLKATTLARFRAGLREVAGATAFISQLQGALPRCIASSSSVERLQVCLEALLQGLPTTFQGWCLARTWSVERGKPHPDLFLYAASRLQVEPASCTSSSKTACLECRRESQRA